MAKCDVDDIKKRFNFGEPRERLEKRCGKAKVEKALGPASRALANRNTASAMRVVQDDLDLAVCSASEIRRRRAEGEPIASLEKQCGQDKVRRALETMARQLAADGQNMKNIVATTGLTTTQARKVLVPVVRRLAADGTPLAEIVGKSGMTAAQVKKALTAMIGDIRSLMKDESVG